MEIEDAFPLPFTLIGAVVAIVSGLICLTMLKWREINKWRLKTAVAFAYGQRAKRKLKTLVNAIKRNAAIDNVHRHIENLSQTCDRDVQTDPGNEDLGLERRASMMIEAIESEGDIQYVIDEDLGLEKKTSMMIEAIESEGDIQVAEVKETGLEQTTNLLELSNQLSAMDYDEQTTEKIIDQLIQDNYRVTCFFNVQNRTANMIDDGRICCTWGNVVVPPTLADPWKNNIVATRKAIHCATGTSGTLSYKIHSDPPRRLVIKWECPFNFDIHSNMLAVGISQQTVECHDNNWYNTMKTEGTHTVDEHFGYDLHYYISSDVRQVLYTDGKYTVYGTMSSCHKAQVLIWLKRNQLQIKRN